MLRLIFILIFAAFLCITQACGDSSTASTPDDCRDGAPPGVGGEFTAVLSGAEDVELCGFATSSGRDGVGWSLQLITPGGENSILFVTEGAGRPIPNTFPYTYDIVDYVATDASPPPEKYVVLIALESDVLGATGFSSIEGTLIILSSSEDQVSGGFDFEARNLQGGQIVTVTGTFTSMNEDL